MSDQYVRSEHLLWRCTSEMVVMLSPEGGGIMELSGTGMALWRLLDRPISLSEAADALGQHFGAAPEAVAADLVPLLAELLEQGIVRQVGAS